MTPETISQIIAQAREQDAKTGQYRQQLAGELEALHALIRVDGDDPVDTLYHFVREYIEMAPGLIECVRVCATRAGVGDLFAPSSGPQPVISPARRSCLPILTALRAC